MLYMETIMGEVEYLLMKHPRLRDNDKELYLSYLFWYTDIFDEVLDFEGLYKKMVKGSIPPPESISRARRKIQNEKGLYKGQKQLAREKARQEMVKWAVS